MPEDHNTRGPRERDRGWSEAACEKALIDCAHDLGESPSIPQYKEWNEGLRPNYTAIMDCLGGWNNAKEELGLATYEPEDGHPNYRLVDKPRRELKGYEHTAVGGTDE